MRLWGKPSSDPAKIEPKTWREAAAAETLHMDAPPVPTGIRLCTHLGVNESTRRALQSLLVEGWTARPKSLVPSFLTIVHGSPSAPTFPPEIAEIVRQRHPRLAQKAQRLEEEVAAIYIGHEHSRWLQRAELEQMAELHSQINGQQPLKVQVLTCQDQRVCTTCHGYEGAVYVADHVPPIPAHWDCRCLYIGVFD